jgi:eukaryotic-like serine/threonine-protein kinase
VRGRDFEFAGTARFEVLSRLGTGGMGVVYEVFDRHINQRAALKTLRTRNAEMLLRFKEEFRGLQHVQHPNLVSLGELIEEDGQWFFTMELVDGVNFIEYVRPPTTADDDASNGEGETAQPSAEVGLDAAGPAGSSVFAYNDARLRSSLVQLAEALKVLHKAHKVHRDIKPSNVLVTRTGRTVLLDFGFIADVVSKGHTTAGIVVGTADYMAPEQAAGKAVEAAADWYAVGVVLYRALTGRLPYTGSRMEVLVRKQQVAPVSPRLLAQVAPDLDALCMKLLAIDVPNRATGDDILAALGASSASPRRLAAVAMSDQPFVGRQEELETLHESYLHVRRGRSRSVYVTGESGVGKTALLECFAAAVRASDHRAIVLVGRCHERESVPYKAVDGLVDVLSRTLRGEPAEEVEAVLPMNVGLLANVFPVLRRVEVIARAAPHVAEPQEPLEQRRRLFAAMGELLARLAERRPLVVIIEDLQWADADSLALLKDIMQGPDEPQLLLIASTRTEAHVDAMAALAATPRFSGDPSPLAIRHLHLQGLATPEARQLAEILLRRAGVEAAEQAADIAQEAAGHPLFIDELVQHITAEGSARQQLPNLEHALWTRIERLDAAARRVLEAVSVAGTPLAQEVAAGAAGLDFGDFSHQVSRMRADKLTKSTGTGRNDEIEPYHSRIRHAVLARLDPAGLEDCHRRLALALEAAGGDPQALATHWYGAGDSLRAADYALAAASQAADAFAFDRAARLYRQALKWRPPAGAFGRRLQTRLGDALANAGRGAEAAQAYLDAAEGSSAAAQLELMRMAADQLLRSGHIDEGLACLQRVLGAAGMTLARSRRRARWSLSWGRLFLRLRGLGFRERDPSQVSLEELTHLDIFATVAIGLANVDFLRGAHYQSRHLRQALGAGEPYRICRALAAEVAYASGVGMRARRRVQRIIGLAGEIADRIENDHARGLVRLAEGTAAALEGRWQMVSSACQSAEEILRERCTNVWWERNSALQYLQWALAMLGQFDQLSTLVPRRLREAEERGDLYAATMLKTGLANLVWLAAGDPGRARREAAEAMRMWSRRGFHLPHVYDLIAQVHIDLYTGDAAAALARLSERWARLDDSLLRRVPMIRIQTGFLRARAALAVGELRAAARMANGLRRERPRWAQALGELVFAGIAHRRGDRAAAIGGLQQAIAGFRECEMSLHAEVALANLGALLGGDIGRKHRADAQAWMARMRIADPSRMSALVAPSFEVS